jgi:hypothetical protein
MMNAIHPPLECYRGKSRVLLVLAPTADSGCVARQRQALAGEEAGLRERDTVVVWAAGGTVAVEGGAGPALDARELACAYGVKPGEPFQALLIGKDGFVHLRSGGPVPAGRLFELIDHMPMRQA